MTAAIPAAPAAQAPTPLRCTRHRDAPTTIRCDRCSRSYCRDCVVSRFITSRSAIWLCRRCAGVRGAADSWTGGPVLRPRAAPRREAGNWNPLRRWMAVLGCAALVLYAAHQPGLLPL
jgi:hypothetical protein